MSKNDMIAHAMWVVLGPAPENPEDLIGYKMAKLYFEVCIEQAEPVYQGIIPPRVEFNIMMKNAVRYSAYPVFLKMPQATQKTIKACAIRFFVRYGDLIKEDCSMAA